MIKTVKVSYKGQIAISRTLRENFGIVKGDDFKDLLKFSEDSLKEVWDNKEDEIWNKYIK